MEHGISYALHYVHDFCRFNMAVNTSHTDVDAAQHSRSIRYPQAEADKVKVLELHKQVLQNEGLPKHDKQHEKQAQDFEVVHSSSCQIDLDLRIRRWQQWWWWWWSRYWTQRNSCSKCVSNQPLHQNVQKAEGKRVTWNITKCTILVKNLHSPFLWRYPNEVWYLLVQILRF